MSLSDIGRAEPTRDDNGADEKKTDHPWLPRGLSRICVIEQIVRLCRRDAADEENEPDETPNKNLN